MTSERNLNDDPRSRGVSRRYFLKLLAAMGLLAGCSPRRRPAPTATGAPTATPRPTDTPMPTDTPSPTHTPAPTDTPTVAPPAAPSTVVHTHHAGVWDGAGKAHPEELAPAAIRQMLDASITELTGLNDAAGAWASLFDPGERIAIKVNTITGSEVCTHVPLVIAVAQSLQDAGVPAEQIFIFDRANVELEDAGYSINREGAGVRCYGTGENWDQPGDYVPGWKLLDRDIGLSAILLNCNALINIPVLKAHGESGLTFAMKNHYGTFDRPWDFHNSAMRFAIPDLNALPPIRDRARLVIGDVLTACTEPRPSSPYWTQDIVGDSILMSFDPVAHDTVGLQLLTQLGKRSGERFLAAEHLANFWLQNAADLGLGTNDLESIELVEVNLG